jgi:bile acid:Na+ symporter, BASS family
MSVAALMKALLSLSIQLIVLSLGLKMNPQDAIFLFRRPGLLLRSLLAMSVVMPIFAGVLVYALQLPPAVEITLVVLSISPVPPILPKKQIEAGGTRSYAMGLLVAAAVVSILFVPVAVELFGTIAGKSLQMSPGKMAEIIVTTIIGPLAVGMALRYVWPRLGNRFAETLSGVAFLLLVAAVLPVLFLQRAALMSLIGNGTLLAMALVATVGLATGSVLGGPERADRTVLALSAASHHPGVAIAIASANFTGQNLILPAILLYLIVTLIVSTLFLRWIGGRKSQNSMTPENRRSPAA